LAPQAVGAEGFAVNEWSAEGMAMGGARMFAENDAANFAYNPASMTKIKGEVAKISATYLSPHGKYKANHNALAGTANHGVEERGNNRIHPAWAPGTYYVRQINDKEWIGMGAYSRFGNSCQFEAGSLPGTNNTSAKINGISMGVNYARKMDSKWSASLGAEVNYIGLQYDKTPMLSAAGLQDALGMGESEAEAMAGIHHIHLEGESYALGWNAALNYTFDDKNEMGIVYRSAVNHSMEADMDTTLWTDPNYYFDAYGFVTLPESVMIGYNHKFNDKTRMELNGTWTRWSRFSELNIYHNHPLLPAMESKKNWSDGWRYALGVEHKLSEKYSLLGGIAYDESSIPDYDGADFMVPTGTRTTFTIGTQYHDEKQTLAFTLGYMKVGDLGMTGHGTDAYATAKMYDSYTKMFSISYQYNF